MAPAQIQLTPPEMGLQPNVTKNSGRTFSTYWEAFRQRPCTCLADVAELDSRSPSTFDKAMRPDDFGRRLPRKWWEWEYIAECAEILGLLRRGSTALGLGVGFEPLIFHFAHHCQRVIATDLYSPDTPWTEARFKSAQQVLDSSPFPYPQDRVEVRNADMRRTGAASSSIDFVWSCSSIEHVPTLRDLFLVFAEISRILKIGGHAILTTEFCVTGNPYLLPGVNAWNNDIFETIKDALPGFEFLGSADLSFNSLHPGNAPRPRRYLPLSSLPASAPHFSYYHRSGSIANPVGLSIIVPIAFVLRKISNTPVADWDAVEIPTRLRTYSDGVGAFFNGKNDIAINKLGEVYRSTNDDLQLKHLAFRFFIDAKARSGFMLRRKVFIDTIEEFLMQLPKGPVQDADALDICGYLLGECGRIGRAMEVYRKCILSPSTSREHVFQLLLRYLALAAKSGVASEATEFTATIIADLVQFGISSSELNRLWLEPLAKKMGTDMAEQVMVHVRQRLARAIDALVV